MKNDPPDEGRKGVIYGVCSFLRSYFQDFYFKRRDKKVLNKAHGGLRTERKFLDNLAEEEVRSDFR